MKIISLKDYKQSSRENGCSISPSEQHKNANTSIREFALNVAEKIRNDPELNAISPVLVDRIVLLLISESRPENLNPREACNQEM